MDLGGTFELPRAVRWTCPPPWRASVAGVTILIHRWDGQTLVRALRLEDGTATPYAAEDVGTLDAPRLRVTLAEPVHRAAVERTLAGICVQAPAALAELAASDPLIARLERRFPACGP